MEKVLVKGSLGHLRAMGSFWNDPLPVGRGVNDNGIPETGVVVVLGVACCPANQAGIP
jgi:hypothetical protein